MATATKSKARRGPNPQTEARKAEIEVLVEKIDDQEPDYQLFLARWGDRYSASNLMRLWVQCPTATCLHKLPTWRGMGRKVKTGEHAIWLRQPHISYDAEKITPNNPKGEVFHGAPWMALFDYSQTQALDDFTDEASPNANPDDLAEVKRLRKEATNLHPDVTGDASQEAARKFSAAWGRYEAARDRLKAA